MVTEKIIGKYCVLATRSFKTNDKFIECPILVTDNAREAVWVANRDPMNTRIEHVCGEKDFYQDDEGKWHSFDL